MVPLKKILIYTFKQHWYNLINLNKFASTIKNHKYFETITTHIWTGDIINYSYAIERNRWQTIK